MKPKFEEVEFSKHLVDCWRLLRSSYETEGQSYPDISVTPDEAKRFALFSYMQSPNFFGMIARVGKKPVGQIIGDFCSRPAADPKNYFFIWNFYIEPEYRKKGVMKQFWPEFMKGLSARGVSAWEANASDKLVKFLTEHKAYETRVLYHRIGGKI